MENKFPEKCRGWENHGEPQLQAHLNESILYPDFILLKNTIFLVIWGAEAPLYAEVFLGRVYATNSGPNVDKGGQIVCSNKGPSILLSSWSNPHPKRPQFLDCKKTTFCTQSLVNAVHQGTCLLGWFEPEPEIIPTVRVSVPIAYFLSCVGVNDSWYGRC